MKKLYFLDEEEKNRILNIHEGATKRQYLNERDAVKNDGSKLESIKSVLVGLGLKPLEQKTLPPGYINLGTNSIPNLQVNTTLGWFVFLSFKPGGYWTPNNFVLQNKNGVITIGTWDFDKLYMKKSGVVNVADKDFNDIIPLSQLKPADSTTKKDNEQPVVNNNTKTEKKKPAVVDRKKLNQQQLASRLKQTQISLGLPESGALDNATLQAMITKLSPRPQVQPFTSGQPAGIQPLSSSSPTAGINTNQLDTI